MSTLKQRLKLAKRRCRFCGQSFNPIRRHQQFDTPTCRWLFHNCQKRHAKTIHSLRS